MIPGRENNPQTASAGVKMYSDITAFYAEDRRRRVSPEHDFGVWWRMEEWSRGDNYRITWVQLTGEFYIFSSQTNRVYLMVKKAESPEVAEIVMNKWAENCGKIPLTHYFPEMLIYAKKK